MVPSYKSGALHDYAKQDLARQHRQTKFRQDDARLGQQNKEVHIKEKFPVRTQQVQTELGSQSLQGKARQTEVSRSEKDTARHFKLQKERQGKTEQGEVK